MSTMSKESKPRSQPFASELSALNLRKTNGEVIENILVHKNTPRRPQCQYGGCCRNSTFYVSGLTNLLKLINKFLNPFLAKICKAKAVKA